MPISPKNEVRGSRNAVGDPKDEKMKRLGNEVARCGSCGEEQIASAALPFPPYSVLRQTTRIWAVRNESPQQRVEELKA